MRIEKINSNQQTFTSKKSVFKYFKNLFSRPSSEKSFETIAASGAAAAIAGIEIQKKKYEAPAVIIKEAPKEKPKTLDEIIPDLPEMSDLKYRLLKKKLQENEEIKKIINIPEDKYDEYIGPEKAQLMAKIMNNPELLKNRNIRLHANKLMYARPSCLNPEQGKVINYILDNERLYNNEELLDDAIKAIPMINKSNINFVLKLLSDEKFDNTYMDCGSDIIFSNKIALNSHVIADSREKLIDKFLNNKLLYENKNVCKELYHTVYAIKNHDDLKYRTEIFDKYLNSPELQEQKHIVANIGDIAECVNNQARLDFTNRLLEDPILYKNADLFYRNDSDYGKKIRRVLGSINLPKTAELMNNFLDLYVSDEKLYNNKNLNKNLANILSSTDENNLTLRKSIMKKYLANPEIQNSEVVNQLGLLVVMTENEENYEVVNKLLSEERLYKNELVVKQLPEIMCKMQQPSDIEIIKKYLDNDELCNNKQVIDSLPDLLWNINFGNSDSYSIRCEILDKILSNKDLYNNKSLMAGLLEFISLVRYDEQIDIVDTVLSNEKLYNDKNVVGSLRSWLWGMDGIGSADRKKYLEIESLLNDKINSQASNS